MGEMTGRRIARGINMTKFPPTIRRKGRRVPSIRELCRIFSAEEKGDQRMLRKTHAEASGEKWIPPGRGITMVREKIAPP